MKPIHYNLHFEPDLVNFVFNDLTEIDMDLENPTEDIILNGKDLTIQKCEVIQGDVLKECNFDFNGKKEEIMITLPEQMSGIVKFKIQYTGNLNDNLLGFYRSKYEYLGETRTTAFGVAGQALPGHYGRQRTYWLAATAPRVWGNRHVPFGAGVSKGTAGPG